MLSDALRAHHHNGRHDRRHNQDHRDDRQRTLDHVSNHPEPNSFREQIHAARGALSGVPLAHFRMHGAKIEFPGHLALIHLIALKLDPAWILRHDAVLNR
jgi:hypothetical protein